MAVKVLGAVLITIIPAIVFSVPKGSPCITPNNEHGTCIAISSCPIIRDAVLTFNEDAIDFARTSRCDYGYGDQPLVCCGSSATKKRGAPCITPNGEPATCTAVTSCEVMLNTLINNPNQRAIKFAQKSQCGYDNEPLVCCGSEANYPSVVSPLLPDRSLCGIPHPVNWVGVEMTDFPEFPWIALLRYKNYDGLDAGFRCGGTLINSRYVLTAAHCITVRNEQRLDLDSVRLGEWRVSTEYDCDESLTLLDCIDSVVDLKIEQKIVHRKYNSRNGKNDIALLRLEKNVNFTEYIRPICLPEPGSPVPPVGSNLSVVGWGATETGLHSDYKLKAKVSITSKSVCAAKTRTRGEINEKKICAMGMSRNHSCRGGSGGPLMHTFPRTWEQWYQEGIFSLDVDCETSEYPAVYTRVSSYVKWIADHLSDF